MRGYLSLFWNELIKLNSIDVLFFSILINLNLPNYFTREIQIVLAIFIIKKALIEHIQTDTIKTLLFLAGVKARKVVLLNLIFSHFIFIAISIIMLFFKITAIHLVIENLIILNFLICLSATIKYIIPLYKIEDFFMKKLFQSIIYFVFFGLVFLNQILSLVIIFLFYTYLIRFFNRTLNYYDIN
jgi:hypothetical protein